MFQNCMEKYCDIIRKTQSIQIPIISIISEAWFKVQLKCIYNFITEMMFGFYIIIQPKFPQAICWSINKHSPKAFKSFKHSCVSDVI